MKKFYIVLIFCILVALPVFATENTVEEPENKTHLSFATGVFSSRYGVSHDFGRFEVALGVDSGFPNLFVIGMVGDPSRPLETLKESVTLFYGGGLDATFDVVPSFRHDLDVGIGANVIYIDLFGTRQLVGNLNAKIRYGYNNRFGGRFFLETNFPVVTYSKDPKSDDPATIAFVKPDKDLLALSLLFATRIGYSVSFH